jgi:DNA-binding transcriptional ArsR family regulator
MVEKRRSPLDAAFAALANPTRRKLLKQLSKGEQSITQLAARHDQTFWAISKHLTVLKDARLVERRTQGRSFLFQASAAPLRAIRAFLDEFEVERREKPRHVAKRVSSPRRKVASAKRRRR